ncbi:MAG: hypothetical protein OJF59_001509 [Cytophagales bacterium]|jgi:hypothetical protein|nr:hypothetical protein [Bacteroidota bacterium]MBS1980441.1 hypothetical protein [Bacteroidota bacterium]WHZ07756.1 MAG: hypothetical protein OJF59_001509 [Cytophagales bacterium]
MAITTLQILEIIEVVESFLTRMRPPEHIRDELDIGYKLTTKALSFLKSGHSGTIRKSFSNIHLQRQPLKRLTVRGKHFGCGQA